MTDNTGAFILSASNYSAYSISVLKLLLTQGVPVRGVMIQKLADRGRLLREFRSSGPAILGKIFRKLILQRLGIGQQLQDGFSTYYKTLGKQPSSLVDLCTQHGIKYLLTSDFHSEESLTFLEASRCALVVFTGGGLVRQALIDRSGQGVVNCHMGVLPKYRGMDCTYWCSLNRDRDNIGFTVHLINAGVDTGPIVEVHKVDASRMATIDEAVFEIEYRMAPAISSAVGKMLRGETTFTPQRAEDGLQYFTISPECQSLAREMFAAEKRVL